MTEKTCTVREDLQRRYDRGERDFPGLDLHGADLRGLYFVNWCASPKVTQGAAFLRGRGARKGCGLEQRTNALAVAEGPPSGVRKHASAPLFKRVFIELDRRSHAWAVSRGADLYHPLRIVLYLNACMPSFDLEEAQRFGVVASEMVRRRRRNVQRWRGICALMFIVIALVSHSAVAAREKLLWGDSRYAFVALMGAALGGVFMLYRDVGVDTEGRRQTEWDKVLVALSVHIEKKYQERPRRIA